MMHELEPGPMTHRVDLVLQLFTCRRRTQKTLCTEVTDYLIKCFFDETIRELDNGNKE